MLRNKILPIYWWIKELPDSEAGEDGEYKRLFYYGFDFRNKDRDGEGGLPNVLFLISKFVPVLKKSDFLLTSLIKSFDTSSICFSSEVWVSPDYSEEEFIYHMKPYNTILCGKSFIEIDQKLENFLIERLYEEVFNDFGNSFSSAETRRLVNDWFGGLSYGE